MPAMPFQPLQLAATACLLLPLLAPRAALAAPPPECPDLEEATAAAVSALVDGRLEDASGALERAERSFSCGQPPEAEPLARFWLAEAAASSLSGEPQDAVDAWQAAARLAPTVWEPRYGPELRQKRDAAVLATLKHSGTLTVDPLPDKHSLVLDGVTTPNPTPAAEGLHLVQISARDVRYGRIVLLAADENMLVRPELPPVEAPVAQEQHQGPRVGLIAGGGASVAAGAGLLVLAARQEAPMDQAAADWRAGALSTGDATDQVSKRWTTQRAAGGAGYALAALGAVGIGVGVLW